MARIIGTAGELQGDQLRKRLALFQVILAIAGPIFGFVVGFTPALISTMLSAR